MSSYCAHMINTRLASCEADTVQVPDQASKQGDPYSVYQQACNRRQNRLPTGEYSPRFPCCTTSSLLYHSTVNNRKCDAWAPNLEGEAAQAGSAAARGEEAHSSERPPSGLPAAMLLSTRLTNSVVCPATLTETCLLINASR